MIGAVIMKVKFEKTGSEIIPNKHFWTELPLMLKVRKYLYSYVAAASILCMFYLSGWSPVHLLTLCERCAEEGHILFAIGA